MRPLPRLDRAGRPQKDPKPIGHELTLTILCAQAGVPLDEVPGQFWQLDADEGGEQVAVVACPCGEDHTVPLLEGPVVFGDPENPETCVRGFFFDSKTVWLLNSPRHHPVGTVV